MIVDSFWPDQGQYQELSKPKEVTLKAETFDDAKLVLKTGYLRWLVPRWSSST